MPIVVLLAVLALAVTAPAAGATPTIGIGEQSPQMFTDPSWTALGIRNVRLVVSWDATRIPFERGLIDGYMEAAARADARVLVAFGRSRIDRRRKVLPSPARYRRAFLAFRRRWPQAREFIAWNEANHCSQPTCHKPARAAAYYDTLRSACRGCTVVAASVLDLPSMGRWVRAFTRAAKHRPRIWGLHNYIDANRFTTGGTRALLRATRGDIWFTETGGVVRRRKRSTIVFPESATHAARATDWVFGRLARLSPRIKRVYLYHWRPGEQDAQWDSALLNRHGRPRPAYTVLHTWVRRVERALRARRRG
ncbi:MAG TPA: hypothetical protein VF533_22385 [Solirubrobacteraceae bacterium]